MESEQDNMFFSNTVISISMNLQSYLLFKFLSYCYANKVSLTLDQAPSFQ